jgi:hypothetical protein
METNYLKQHLQGIPSLYDVERFFGTCILSKGADPNGVNDSTGAFLRAIDETPTGGVLVIPWGTFLLSPGLVITRSDIRIVGNGTIKCSDTTSGIFITWTGSRVSFEGITFDGADKTRALFYSGNQNEDWSFTRCTVKAVSNGTGRGIATNTTDCFIVTRGCRRFRFSRCTFFDVDTDYAPGAGDSGIRCIRVAGNGTDTYASHWADYRFDDISIDDCDFYDIGPTQLDADPIVFQNQVPNAAGHQTCNFVITNCRFRNIGRRAIKLECGGGIVAHNDIYSTRLGPVASDTVFAAIGVYGPLTVVDNNKIHGHSYNYGIDVCWLDTFGQPFGITITGNTIHMQHATRTSSFGIALRGVKRATVTGNTVYGCDSGYLVGGSCEDITLIGNHAEHIQNYGIVVLALTALPGSAGLAGTPDMVSILGGVINSDAYSIFLSAGTNVDVTRAKGTAGSSFLFRNGGVTGSDLLAQTTNIRNDEIYNINNGRGIAGGIFVDSNAASYKITGGTGLPLGLNDFSIRAVLSMRDFSDSDNPVIIASHGGGNNRFLYRLSSSGSVLLQIINSGGTITTYTLTPDVAFVDGNVYSLTVTVDRDGLATLYVDGVSDRDANGTIVTTSVAASSAIDIGNGNVTAISVGLGLDGALYSLQVFNRVLTANEVLALQCSGAPTFDYQYGSTDKYTSDFSAGADSWAVYSTSAITGNTDSIGGQDNTLLINSNAGTIAAAQRTLQRARKNGNRIKISYDVYIPSTNVTGVAVNLLGDSGTGVGFTVRTPVANTWTTYSQEIVVTRDMTVLLPILLTAGGASATVTAGDKFYIKNVVVEYPGCVGDWDFANTNPQLSTTLVDITGNNNLTISHAAGQVHQVRPVRRGMFEGLVVGAPSAGTGTTVTKILQGSGAINFGSIAAGATSESTFTVTGAAVGDAVAPLIPSTIEAGLNVTMRVTAANTVTVRVHNSTAGAIDPANQTFGAVVFSIA